MATGAMTVSGLGEPQAQGWAQVDPAKLGARVGDYLSIQAIAVDNAPGAGFKVQDSRFEVPEGQRGESAPLTVRIVSDDDYRALMANRYGAEQAREDAERFMNELADQSRAARALVVCREQRSAGGGWRTPMVRWKRKRN